MHHTAAQILSQHSDGRLHGVRYGEVELAVGDTCDNPASTKDVLYGPALVKMTQYPDGAVHIETSPIPEKWVPEAIAEQEAYLAQRRAARDDA